MANNPAYPGARFTQEELDENAKWAKAHDEFDVSNWDPRSADVVLESIGVKLDTLNRTMKTIKFCLEILVWGAIGLVIAMLLR